jgi:hypothetical protein
MLSAAQKWWRRRSASLRCSRAAPRRLPVLHPLNSWRSRPLRLPLLLRLSLLRLSLPQRRPLRLSRQLPPHTLLPPSPLPPLLRQRRRRRRLHRRLRRRRCLRLRRRCAHRRVRTRLWRCQRRRQTRSRLLLPLLLLRYRCLSRLAARALRRRMLRTKLPPSRRWRQRSHPLRLRHWAPRSPLLLLRPQPMWQLCIPAALRLLPTRSRSRLSARSWMHGMQRASHALPLPSPSSPPLCTGYPRLPFRRCWQRRRSRVLLCRWRRTFHRALRRRPSRSCRRPRRAPVCRSRPHTCPQRHFRLQPACWLKRQSLLSVRQQTLLPPTSAALAPPRAPTLLLLRHRCTFRPRTLPQWMLGPSLLPAARCQARLCALSRIPAAPLRALATRSACLRRQALRALRQLLRFPQPPARPLLVKLWRHRRWLLAC